MQLQWRVSSCHVIQLFALAVSRADLHPSILDSFSQHGTAPHAQRNRSLAQAGRKGETAVTLQHRLAVQRKRQGLQAPHVTNIRRLLKGGTYNRDAVETRGRAAKLSSANVLRMNCVRKDKLKHAEADGVHRGRPGAAPHTSIGYANTPISPCRSQSISTATAKAFPNIFSTTVIVSLGKKVGNDFGGDETAQRLIHFAL